MAGGGLCAKKCSNELVEETDQSTKILASHLKLSLLVPGALQIPSGQDITIKLFHNLYFCVGT